MNKLIKILISCSLTVIGTAAVAKSVYIIGSITSVPPKVEFTYPDEIYRGVKEYSALAKEAVASGCRLETVREEAYTSDSSNLKCFFEWTGDTDPSWNANGLALDGRPTAAAGEHYRSYRISYFNGIEKERITLIEDSVAYTTLEPVPPVIVNVTTDTTSAQYQGLSFITHDKNEKLRKITVEVEPRPFDQVVALTQFGESCEVPEGQDSCVVAISAFHLSGDDSLTGQLTTALKVSDKYDVVSAPNSQIQYAWDYRPPVIEQYAVKAVGDTTSNDISIDVGGETVVVQNNEAVVVLSSPHSTDTANKWWLPSKVSLSFEEHTDHVGVSDFVTLEGRDIGDLFRDEHVTYTEKTVDSFGIPQQIGNKFVYRIPLSSVVDGFYQGNIKALDRFANRGDKEVTAMQLDRLPPEIRLYNNDTLFSTGDEINFMEHMIFTVQDETSIENEITDILLDGVPVEHIGEFKMARAIKMETPWESNTVHKVIVRGKDGNNNVVQREYSISFLPLDFQYDNISDRKVALVQNQDITFAQTKGRACRMFKSEHEAVQGIKNPTQMTCSVNWTVIPQGLEEAWDTASPELIGVFENTGPATVEAEIYIHDSEGRKNLIKVDDTSLIVHTPDTPEIIFDDYGMFEDGIYAVEMGQSRIGRYRVKSAASPIYITLLKNGETIESQYIKQSNRYTEHTITKVITDRNSANHRDLWQMDDYAVQVHYARLPEQVIESAVKTYAVPSTRARLKVEQTSRETSTVDTFKVKSKFGLYSSFYRDVVYKSEELGDWSVRIAVMDKEKNLHGLTDWQDMNESGMNDFDVNFSSDDMGDLRFYTQAKLKSPNENYVSMVRSQRGTLKIMKGTAIEGELRTLRITGSVPMNAAIQYQHLTRDDKDASGEVSWYISEDNGSTWNLYGEPGKRFSFSTAVEGIWLVKGHVPNRFTGEIAETDVVQIMAYRVPQTELVGAANLITGMTRTYTLLDQGEEADAGNMLIKWSIDGGVTFTEGGSTLEYTATGEGSNKIIAKAAYLGYETDEQSWATEYRSVRSQRAKPVRVRVKGDTDVETTDTLTLVGDVDTPYSNMDSELEIEWVRPDGTIVDSNVVDFTPTNDDLDRADFHTFTLRAWVKDAKALTYAEFGHKVRVWEYQFPQFDVAYKQRVLVAPSVIEIWLRRPIGANLREYYLYEWNGQGRLELTKDYGHRARFTAKQAGIYPISVTIEDDRGNYDTFTEYVEVLEPEPITVDLTARYSNSYQRSPLDVNVRPTIRGGHPSDRVADYQWYVDGELQPELEKSSANIENLLTGDHELKLKILTNYGQEAEAIIPIEVVPNQPPTCSIDYRMYSKTARIEAKCKDLDGKMVKYDWTVGDNVRRNIGKRISELRQPGESELVTVVGYDDSGDTATAQMVVRW